MYFNNNITNLIFSFSSLYNKQHDLVNLELLKYTNQIAKEEEEEDSLDLFWWDFVGVGVANLINYYS